MLRACRQRKVDRILCKSLSRFARNTVDCLDTVRELRDLGISVYFEKDYIKHGKNIDITGFMPCFAVVLSLVCRLNLLNDT